MKRTVIMILLLVMALFVGAAAAENTEVLGQPFPDFTVEDTEGNTFTLSEALKDHEAVLVNIWATWCPPCRGEFPDLNEVYQEYKDRVAFIALSSETSDTIPVIADFRKGMGLEIPMGREAGTGLTSYLSITGIPTTVVVDRFGKAVYMQSGAFAGAGEVKRLLDSFLGEKYTETSVLDRIPRDTTTRALPVSAARALHVENENARRLVFHAAYATGKDEYTAYVINDDTARLRIEISAADDPSGMIYYDGSMNDMPSLLDAERNEYVYEQPMPSGEDGHYTSGVLVNKDADEDPDAIQVFLIAGEQYIEEFANELRSMGYMVDWQYEEVKQPEQAAAEAYILHLVDQNGQPVSGVMANFCTNTACSTMVSDEKGIISVGGAPEDYHVQLLKAPEGYSFDQGFEMHTGTAFGEWVVLIRKD